MIARTSVRYTVKVTVDGKYIPECDVRFESLAPRREAGIDQRLEPSEILGFWSAAMTR